MSKKIYPMKSIALLIFTLILFSSSCKESRLKKKVLNITKKDGTTIQLKAELAITPEERQYGFMNRKNIPDGTGMLFVFENDQILSFWMKNTPSPLSIAYITTNGEIKDIFDMTPFSLASITSTGYVKYALEVPQGWYKKTDISAGDKLVLDF